MNINGYVPKKHISANSLLSLSKTSIEDVFELLYAARDFKQKAAVGEKTDVLHGKYVALLTKNTFFRTRIAFQIAIEGIGGNAMILPLSGSSIEDYLKDRDGISAIRGYGVKSFAVDTSVSKDAEVIDGYSDLPIINANSKTSPCQALASLFTVWQRKGKLQDLKMAIVGNFSGGDYSLLYGAAKCGIDLNLICPEPAEPERAVADYCRQFCDIEIYDNLEDGLSGADAVYVMSHDLPLSYMLGEKELHRAKPDALILHPLPVRRDEEISETLLDSPFSVINEQSANILPVLKAAFSLIVGKKDFEER